MATIDDLTTATTELLNAVTVGKAALDLAVDQTNINVNSVNNMHAEVAEWVNETFGYRNAASSFATSASNSAVTATARAIESSQNATLSQTYRNAAQGYSLTAVGARDTAVTAADDAELSATEAATSAASALALPSTNATSVTSMTIASGTQTLITQTGKNIVPGMSLNIAAGSTPTANWVHGIVESYNSSDGTLIFVVDLANGTGTFADWVISLSAPVGSNSINLTGVPTAPTAPEGTNTSQLANTEFVHQNATLKTGYNNSAVIPVGTTLQRDLVPSAGLLRFNSEGARFEGHNGVQWAPVGVGGLNWMVVASDAVTEAGVGLLVNTAGSVRSIAFHLDPVEGDIVGIADLKGSFNINPCTIATSGVIVHGEVLNDNMILDVPNQRITFVYAGLADGWIITSLM